MNRTLMLAALSAAVMGLTGCSNSGDSANAGPLAGLFQKKGPEIPAGTVLEVTLSEQISSETAQSGDTWSGTLVNAISAEGAQIAPAGAVVHGEIEGAKGAERGDRAMLDLRVTSIEIDGNSRKVSADTEPVIAGSPRARNLGAIAGGAAAGALIGKAVGGDAEDAAAGAIIGGTAAGVGVAASRGYQVVLKSGTQLSFTVQ